MSSNAPDQTLIAAYLAGDMAAFDALYTRYERELFGFLLSLGGSWSQAEDVMQQTWIQALDALPRYRDSGRFKAWLFRIAHRQWLDLVRSAWERRRVSLDTAPSEESTGVPLDQRLVDPGPLPREQAMQAEHRGRLYRAVEQLPDTMRQALLLRLDAGMTHQEIATALGCPIGTALWRVNEARRRVVKHLKDS